jgi:iron complex outermembrane receptor protein
LDAFWGAKMDQNSSDNIEKIAVSGVRQAFRGDVPLSEQPQSIEFISAENLDDAGVTTLTDIFDLTPSISEQNDFGGLWESFAIRGLVGDENIPSGFLINGFSSGRSFSGTRDTSNIDYVEVMKGPGSALYGRSEPGGTINIITKKPQFEEQGSLKVSAGSWQSYRAEGDYTNAINDQVAFRINGAIEDGEGFRDYHENKKTVIKQLSTHHVRSRSPKDKVRSTSVAWLFFVSVRSRNCCVLMSQRYLFC